MSVKKSRETCVCIIVRSPQIEAIRAKYDKQATSQPPMIRLIYPFVPTEKYVHPFQAPTQDFPTAADLSAKIAEAISNVRPFEITIDRVDSFLQKFKTTICLRPDTESCAHLRELYAKVMPVVDPQCKRKFNPRIVCGKLTRDKLKKKGKITADRTDTKEIIGALRTNFKPIRMSVEGIQIASWETGIFRIVNKILF